MPVLSDFILTIWLNSVKWLTFYYLIYIPTIIQNLSSSVVPDPGMGVIPYFVIKTEPIPGDRRPCI